MREGADVGFILRQKSVWDEFLRVWPVAGVVVEVPDGHLHYVSGLEGQVGAG